MGLKQSTTDLCLYYKWVDGQIVMMMSCIDDNAIVGQESNVIELKKALILWTNLNAKTADLWKST